MVLDSFLDIYKNASLAVQVVMLLDFFRRTIIFNLPRLLEVSV